jgi:hypothetical protein
LRVLPGLYEARPAEFATLVAEEERTPRALSAVWNDTLLIERIAEGWAPADSPQEDPDVADSR